MRVLAAMSGGVDSAVAAARAVDAGHEVTGVHLALSRNPSSYRTGARGCCTLEDARDARRAADVLGIPFYVWDLAERFHADVVTDFVQEYAAGRTPNPCLRCNEKIKFAAVLDRALALGFDAVCTGHYAQLVDGPGGRELHRSVDPGKDQSYVLGVLTAEQLAHAYFPLGGSQKSAVRAEAARPWARGRRQARQPRHLLRRRRRHRRLPGPRARRAARARGRRGRHGAGRARRGVRVHRRAAPRPAPWPAGHRRQASLRAVHRAGEPDGDRRLPRPAVRRRPRGHPAAVVRPGADRPGGVPGADPGTRRDAVARAWVEDDVLRVALAEPATGVAPGQAVVLYSGTRVIGSATISATAPGAYPS